MTRVGIYLTDLKTHYELVNGIYRKRFSAFKPARKCIGVAALPMGALIEVEGTAKNISISQEAARKYIF